ncbi:hypothetical protein J5N97_008740 [Dioscorea zingiberensis]|uniref:RRP12-like protein n=1 Tax=Dioscorea zingiberensis TaxID=325984 RepID=A0A9D5CY68_9LILI|nr:hypothetical protein J5N97_008740 [Dioscorea zingiberensis]
MNSLFRPSSAVFLSLLDAGLSLAGGIPTVRGFGSIIISLQGFLQVLVIQQSFLLYENGSDVCKAIIMRYMHSSAPQHRHLCASAAALRSILLDEGLPLTPSAYFAAAITAFRDFDINSTAALSSFISILLPFVPTESITPVKAGDVAFVLAAFLKDPPSDTTTGTIRSVVKCLGFLTLRVDTEDWSAVQLPLENLITFSMDMRPKVRRCAQVCVERVFKMFQSSAVKKMASKALLDVYNNFFVLAKEHNSFEPDVCQNKLVSKSGQMKILHMLSFLKQIIPYLSRRVNEKILADVYKHLDCHFTFLTRHILSVLKVLVEHSKVEVLVQQSQNIISSLISYLSVGKKNPVDTVVSVSTILGEFLHKLHGAEPKIFIENLPQVVASISGCLNSDVNASKHAASVLQDLFNCFLDQRVVQIAASHSGDCGKESTPETIAITCACTALDNMVTSCGFPSEHVLEVIALLLLKLGESSYFFMKDILLKLAQWAMDANEDVPGMKHLQECIGVAVIAMGPEKLLSLIPIYLNKGKMTCSNTWLIPILKKFVIGASLHFFIEHIAPLARSFQKAYEKAKGKKLLQNLKSCSHDLWDLLPVFCRYPTDISQSFESLCKILIVTMKEDPSLHETVAIALQELVTGSKNILLDNQDNKQDVYLPIRTILENAHLDLESLPLDFSRKTASRNIKALGANSIDLIQIMTDIFLDSPPEKRTYIKEAIGCLAYVAENTSIQNFFVSLLEKLDSPVSISGSDSLDGHVQVGNKKEEAGMKFEQKCVKTRCLIMELASALVEAADEDLIIIIFDYIRPSLLAIDETDQCKAYYVLSTMLKEHSWFCSAWTDDLIDLLLSKKGPADLEILKYRFLCFQYLLVNLLKSKGEKTYMKAFLVLNEIILTLKSKKESRKLAYDLLLNMSSSLKNSESSIEESNLERLFYMIMGYLSSSSPHIMSGAVSALSLLIYNNPVFCLAMPNLVTSVLALLQNKDNEVIKATLGFVKVLVSSLQSNDLPKILPDIVDAILPWSSVSKHHFRSKVGIILEILMRKCGYDAVDTITPTKYKGFVKNITEARESRKHPREIGKLDAPQESADSKADREKRARPDTPGSFAKKSRVHKIQQFKPWKKHQKVNSSMTNSNQAAAEGSRIQSLDRAGSSTSEIHSGDKTSRLNKNRKRKPNENPRQRYNDKSKKGSQEL